MRFKPRPYQNTAVEEVIKRFQDKSRKMLLYLPTGAGKTVIAAFIIEKFLKNQNFGKILFVAHRQEILDQTARTIKNHLKNVSIEIEQGKRTTSNDVQITVASVQSLVKRKAKFNPKEYSLIICDECHRALSPTWTELIKYFYENKKPDTLLLGMTATPRRTDGRSAVTVFDEIAFEISKTELQDLGYLVPIHYFTVQTKLGLDKVKLNAGDFQIKALSNIMNHPQVRELTLRAWLEKGRGKKTIAFCAGVLHAHQIAKDFSDLGFKAQAIDGKTKNRETIIKKFQCGDIDVLTNYGVLTEGFDDPTVECVLLARPTTSPLVYNQCIGRGLRPAREKTACTIIDIIDRSTHQLQYGASELAGLPKNWKSSGRDPYREKRALDKVKVTTPDAFLKIKNAESLEDIQSILMSLPPECVTAGLDGEPVLRYIPLTKPTSDEQAREECIGLLKQTRARYRNVLVEAKTLQISFHSPEIYNERYEYLKWHLERVSGRTVNFKKPRGKKPNPKALLRSMISKTYKMRNFQFNKKINTVTVQISDLTTEKMEEISSDFFMESGLNLEVKGQMSLLQ
jgi:ATP-dependent helicase IRC3